MPERGREPAQQQRVSVVLTLRGLQDTAVVAHQPNTDAATVSVRIGRALIYFHDWAGAMAVMQGCRQVAHRAARLPAVSRLNRGERAVGAVVAATAIDVVGTPTVDGMLHALAGSPSRLVITIGGLALVIHDRNAYASTRQAFNDAAALADRVLPKPAVPDLRLAALDQAGRALAAPPRTVGARPPGAPVPRREPATRATPGRELQ